MKVEKQNYMNHPCVAFVDTRIDKKGQPAEKLVLVGFSKVKLILDNLTEVKALMEQKEEDLF